jgi:Aspartyl protease
MPAVSFRHDYRQILIPVAVVVPDSGGRFHKAMGLIDTGATVSGISRGIAEDLGLVRRGKTVITTPSGDHVARLYRMGMGLYPDEATDPAALPFILHLELIAIECSPGRNFDVLIGMDVIGRSLLQVQPDGSGTLTINNG